MPLMPPAPIIHPSARLDLRTSSTTTQHTLCFAVRISNVGMTLTVQTRCAGSAVVLPYSSFPSQRFSATHGKARQAHPRKLLNIRRPSTILPLTRRSTPPAAGLHLLNLRSLGRVTDFLQGCSTVVLFTRLAANLTDLTDLAHHIPHIEYRCSVRRCTVPWSPPNRSWSKLRLALTTCHIRQFSLKTVDCLLG